MNAPCVRKFVLPAASFSTDFSGSVKRDPISPADAVGPNAEGSLILSAANRGAGLAGDAMHEDSLAVTELVHDGSQEHEGRGDRLPAVT